MAEIRGNRRRTVVTGQGMVTPLGRTPDEIWTNWASGQCAVGPLTKVDFGHFGLTQAAEITNFEPRKEIRNRKLLRLMIGGEPFGFVAATKAFEDAGLTPDDYPPERAGVAVGCHKEGFRDQNLYDALDVALRDNGTLDRKRLVDEGIRRIPPQTLVEGLANAALYYFAHEFVLQGVNHNFIASGSGGTLAIGEAMRSIRRGEADVMLAGAYDTWVDWKCVGHLRYSEVIPRDEAGEAVHRPFDRQRCGGMIGEGAGMVILEDRERATARGATILGQIDGFALGTGLSEGKRAGQAARFAAVIRRALDDADCSPKDIHLVHLHGDATPAGDWIEASAVRQALGAHAQRIPATTLKSATGLLGNGSGPVELMMTLEMCRRGEVLPIVNLEHPDPELSLNFVRERRTGQDLRRALVLQHGMPRHLTALVVSLGDR